MTNKIIRLFLVTLSLVSITTFGQNNSPKVTVLLFDNQNPNSKVRIDTLLKGKKISLSETRLDLFFASKNFHLPYYAPTQGIFKNAAKDKECNMQIYPHNVKCYEYDNQKRVIKMTVNGSGTMNIFIYKYNDKSQIIEIIDNDIDKYLLTYNSNGTISELKKSNSGIDKKLVFIYD